MRLVKAQSSYQQRTYVAMDRLRFEALNRLWERVRETSHDFRATTEIFPNLDIERVATDLDLAKKGARRGKEKQPPKGGKSFDDIELAIIERIEEEKKSAHQALEDQLQSFRERLTNLDFESQFAMIRQAISNAVSDYSAERQSGIDELHGPRRSLADAENERTAFRNKHRLYRAARVQPRSMKIFKSLLLVLFVLFESGLNGIFLAEGNEQGLVGGTTVAAGFAVLNIGVAFIAAFLVKQFLHRSVIRKLVGLLASLAYLSLAGLINLALAHYRETAETFFMAAGREVMRRINAAPFELADVDSWVLCGIGIIFSVAAFVDTWLLTDPYPGYTGVEERLQKARKKYADTRHELIEELRAVRDEYVEKTDDIIRGLSDGKRQYDAIIAHRSSTILLFDEHQNHLERAANQLLAVYREENRKERSDSPPKHFNESYALQRIKPRQQPIGELNNRELAESIRKTRDELATQSQRIGDEFAKAVEGYHNLDTLHPDRTNGQA